jgi:hypothetical protein
MELETETGGSGTFGVRRQACVGGVEVAVTVAMRTFYYRGRVRTTADLRPASTGLV